jgi:hypothetical protein
MTESHDKARRAPPLLPAANRDKIEFRLSSADRPGFTLVEVDVGKLEEDWRMSGDGYIAPDGTGATEGRLDRFAAWLAAHPGERIDAPWIYLDGRDRVAFADGRHRFALLRNRGYRQLKVAVRKKQAAMIRKLFSPN